MRYQDRSPWIRLNDLLQFIADEATDGDLAAAWDDLFAAIADDATTAYGIEENRSYYTEIPKWAFDAVRRDVGWVADGRLFAHSTSDPLCMYTNIYRQCWTDVRFRREATALWERNQPTAAAPAEQLLALPRKPGPRPLKRLEVEAAMRADLEQLRFTEAELDSMKQVEMEERYDASAETCRKARATVLSEFVGDRPLLSLTNNRSDSAK